MHDEDILLRSTQGIAYLAIAPCIFLSAAVWFTSDSIGIVTANLFQVYFSILLFFVFGKIWSLQSNFGEQYKSQLKKMALKPIPHAGFVKIVKIIPDKANRIGIIAIISS